MTEQQIIDEINRAKQFKRIGQFDTALSILQNLETTVEAIDEDALMLGHVYKATSKIFFIQGQDDACYARCVMAAQIFAIHGDQAEAFNVAGTLGCLHPHFSEYRQAYANSLQGIGQFTNQEIAFQMAQVGIQALQDFFGQ